MNWKLKAVVQNAISVLPESISYGAYYRLQRLAGGLRRINPTSRLTAAIDTWRRLLAAGADPVGKTFFEIGAGRMVTIPTAYWLMGAEKTISVDLNPYLKKELVHEALRYIAANREHVASLFGELLDEKRFARVLWFAQEQRFDLAVFLDAIGVDYRAPSDAGATGLPDGAIDFHTSYTVMEHIPSDVLSRILTEGRRLMRPGGMAVHGIDYSDHFSHSDPKITAVNFLRFSPEEWGRYTGNRYMYMNRLRHADYLRLFNENQFAVTQVEPVLNTRALVALESGELAPHAAFAGQPNRDLAITSAWIVACPVSEVSVVAA